MSKEQKLKELIRLIPNKIRSESIWEVPPIRGKSVEGILVLLGLAVLAVPVLLIVALVSISGLKRRVTELEGQVAG